MPRNTPSRRVKILGQRLLIPGPVFHDQTPGVSFYGTVQRACSGNKRGSMWVKMDDDPGTYHFKISELLDWMVDKEDAEILRLKYENPSGKRQSRPSTTKTTPSDRATPSDRVTRSSGRRLTTPEGPTPADNGKDTTDNTGFMGATTSTSGGEPLIEPAISPFGTRLALFGGQAIELAWKTAKSLSMSPWRVAGGSPVVGENEDTDEDREEYDLNERPDGTGEVMEVVGRRVVQQVRTSYVSVQGKSGTTIVTEELMQHDRVEGMRDDQGDESSKEDEEPGESADNTPGMWSWSRWLPSGDLWNGFQSGQGAQTCSPGGGWWRWGSASTKMQPEAEEQEEAECEEETLGVVMEEPVEVVQSSRHRDRVSMDLTTSRFSSPVKKRPGVAGGLLRTTQQTATLHYHRLLNEPRLKYLSDPPEEELRKPLESVAFRSAPVYEYPQQHYMEECSWLVISYGAAAGALVFIWSAVMYYGFFIRVLAGRAD